MKKLLTLILCWLLAFSAMAENTFKAYSSASVAGGYITSLNKVDGSFEDGSTQWVASVGTIIPTASTIMQGEKIGVWSGTGAGTLDLQWIATASNTYEASAQVDVQGEDDVYVCAYVGTTETGCKLIPALSKIQKVSVVADSVMSSAFYLRLKHTGSDAFSVKVDDGKIEPWTPQAVNLVEQESAVLKKNAAQTIPGSGVETVVQLDSTSDSSRYPLTSYGIKILSSGNYTIKLKGEFGANSDQAYLGYKINSSTTVWGKVHIVDANASGSFSHFSDTFKVQLNVNDIIYFYAKFGTATARSLSNAEMELQLVKLSENVVQSWQGGMAKTATLSFSQVNALAGNQGFGSFTSGFVSYSRDGDSLIYNGKLTTGTTSGVEARIPLPQGIVSAGIDRIPSIQVVGIAPTGNADTTSFYTMVEPSAAYITFGYQSGGLPVKKNGSDVVATGEIINFTARIPIAGWSSTPTLLALPTSKSPSESATFSNAGTIAISSISSDWITSISRSGMGTGSIDYSKLSLTKPPALFGTDLTGNGRVISFSSITTTSATWRTESNSGAAADGAFSIKLEKQSPDYTAPGVFVGNVAKNQVVFVSDVKASGTSGGASVSGAFYTRDLNTVEGDTSIVSVSGNQFTLQAGEYEIEWTSPFYKSDMVQTRLYNVSDAQVMAYSANTNSGSTVISECISIGKTKIVLTAAKTLSIQYRTYSSFASTGLGGATSFGTIEKYTQVKITKLNGQ